MRWTAVQGELSDQRERSASDQPVRVEARVSQPSSNGRQLSRATDATHPLGIPHAFGNKERRRLDFPIRIFVDLQSVGPGGGLADEVFPAVKLREEPWGVSTGRRSLHPVAPLRRWLP